MKHTLSIGAIAISSILLCNPASAQSQPAPDMTSGSAGDASALVKTATNTQESSQMLASHIIGMPVRNGNGDKAQEIGKITDLVLDKDKQAVNVLIGVGGVLGIGAKDVGVPLSEVQFTPGAKFAVASLTKEQLEKAPTYTTAEMKESHEKAAVQPAQPAPSIPPAQPAQPAQPAPAAPLGGTQAQ